MSQVAKVTSWEDWMKSGPLRSWRASNGIGVMQTASRLEVSTTTLQLWENGVNPPSMVNMKKLADLLGVSLGTLAPAWHDWLGRKP